MLKMRLNRRAEETVEQAYGGIEAFQEYLNSHPSYMFRQTERKRVNGKWVAFRPSTIMLCGNLKLVLSSPIIAYEPASKQLYYYNRIVTILEPNRNDRADALTGREVTEDIELEPDMADLPLGSLTPTISPVKRAEERVQETAVAEKKEAEVGEKPPKPTPVEHVDRQKFLIAPLCLRCGTSLVPQRGMFCQHCGAELSDGLAVRRELVVAIRPVDYKKLADHLKQELNVAWSQLTRGRKVERVSSMGVNIFLITLADEMRTSTLLEEKRFDELLVEAGIGRVSADPYEIKEARKMLASAEKPT